MFDEPQVFRIDHYLGKETVQNLMALRFANALFEPVWNRNYIDHVQITAAEDIGIGSRAGYYEGAGALRDLVQNHMLQLLALLTMEPPTAFEADRAARREGQGAARRSCRRRSTRSRRWRVRAQYGAGRRSAASAVAGYREEDGRRARLAHRDLRGAAPARLQLALGGRAVLPAHRQAAGAQGDRDRGARSSRCRTWPSRARGSVGVQANQIILTLQPDEGVSVSLGRQDPGRADADPAGEHGVPLRHVVHVGVARGLRAADPRRDARRRDAVHAQRRDRGAVGDHRPDPRRPGTRTRPRRSRSTRPARPGPREADALLDDGQQLAAAVSGQDVWSERDTTPGRDRGGAARAAARAPRRERGARARRACSTWSWSSTATWKGEIANRLERVGRYHASRTILCAVEEGRTTLDAVAVDELRRAGSGRHRRDARARRDRHRAPTHLRGLETIVDPIAGLRAADRAVVRRTATTRRSTRCCGADRRDAARLRRRCRTPADGARRAPAELPSHAYVVDLAWLRTTPWRERLAASFDPPERLPALRRDRRADGPPPVELGARARCCWPAGWRRGCGWDVAAAAPRNGRACPARPPRSGRRQVDDRLETVEQEAPGLAGVTVAACDGLLAVARPRPGGLRAQERTRDGQRARVEGARRLARRGRDPRRGRAPGAAARPDLRPGARGGPGAVPCMTRRDRGRRGSRRGPARRCSSAPRAGGGHIVLDRRLDAEGRLRAVRRGRPGGRHRLSRDTLLVRRRALRRARRRALQLGMVKEALLDPLGRDRRRPTSTGSRASSARTRRADDYERALRDAGLAAVRPACCSGSGPTATPRRCSPISRRCQERSRLVVGVPEAGLEPFVPRVTLTLPALRRGPAGRVPRHRRVQGRGGRRRVRSRRAARSARAVVAAAARAPSEITVLLDRPPPRARAGRFGGRVSEVIGVDLGGTKVAVAPLGGRELGESLRAADRPLRAAEALIDQLVAMVDEIRGERRLDAVGIGVPSIVEFETGRVVSSVNIPLADVPLREVLGERLGVPVFVDNDATVAALAEAHDDRAAAGRAQPRDDHDRHRRRRRDRARRPDLPGRDRRRRRARPHARRPRHLSRRDAGAGRVPAARLARVRGRGPRARPAGRARRAAEHPDSALGGCSPHGKPVRGRGGRGRAATATRRARGSIELWGERLGIGIANAINTFDPEEVVIGGGGAHAPASCCSSRRGGSRLATWCRGWAAGRDPAGPPRRPRRACSARRCSPRTSSRAQAPIDREGSRDVRGEHDDRRLWVRPRRATCCVSGCSP